MQFLGNFGKIVCWRPPPWGVGAPPQGNPGSATGCGMMMLVNVQLDISVATSRLHFKVTEFTCLVLFISNFTAKKKLTILAFFYSDQFVKNYIGTCFRCWLFHQNNHTLFLNSERGKFIHANLTCPYYANALLQ